MKFALAAIFVSATEYDDEFLEFETRFHKKYDVDSGEREVRRGIFAVNMKYMEAFNSESDSVTLGIGPFADRTKDEFSYFATRGRVDTKNGEKPRVWGDLPHLGTVKPDPLKLFPESIDWVEDGAVTSVKNQGECGSCWSFSTTGSLEGFEYVRTGNLTGLSQQNLLDCDEGNYRCNGGLMDAAFTYIRSHGICSEASYPYACVGGDTAEACRESTCHSDTCDIVIPRMAIAGYLDVYPVTIGLKYALTQGPTAVAIDADSRVFQHYTSGVVTSPYCGEDLGHAVLAVGYGSLNGTKYWLVKNSWGASWGEEGYVKIGMGLNKEYGGECGILKMCSYPVLMDTDEDELEQIYI